MVAPALGKMAEEFGITEEIEMYMMLSVFVLAYAFGPLVLVSHQRAAVRGSWN